MNLIVGCTNARARFRAFRIKTLDRLSHLYAIGETGVGKTTFLEGMIRQDIAVGTGCAFIDPHGDVANRLLAHVPPRVKDAVVYIDLADCRTT